MRRSRVTTSRCLILPLQMENSMRAGEALAGLSFQSTPLSTTIAANTPETAHTSYMEAFSTHFASGSYSDHILLNSSKW